MFHFNLRSFEMYNNIRLVLRLHSLVFPKFFLIPMLKFISSMYVFFLLCLIYSLQIKNWEMFGVDLFTCYQKYLNAEHDPLHFSSSVWLFYGSRIKLESINRMTVGCFRFVVLFFFSSFKILKLFISLFSLARGNLR